MIVHLAYPKRKSMCFHCKEPIAKGERSIRFRVKLGQGKKNGKFTEFFAYRLQHFKCFIQFCEAWFDQHHFVEPRRKAKIIPEARGEYNKLTARIRYYRRTGNEDKVRLLEAKAKGFVLKK